jgi:hypothetical protein
VGRSWSASEGGREREGRWREKERYGGRRREMGGRWREMERDGGRVREEETEMGERAEEMLKGEL